MKYLSRIVAFVGFLGFISFTSCTHKKEELSQIAFSLSDTMMNRCHFEKVSFQDVKNQIRFFGNITAENNKSAQVFPVVNGVVKSINVDLGDYVKQGQILATIQSTDVAGIQKEKNDALNDEAVARKNLQVAQDMYAGKLNSEQDVIEAKAAFDKAQSEVKRTNEVNSIYGLGKGSVYNVVAPISGFVATKMINRNEQIRSDSSDPLFSIADINEVWALANVNESDISQIKVGYDADIKTLAFPDTPYKGKVDKIFNAIDPNTKSIKVLVKLPNTDLKLKPEMNCTVTISFSEHKQMIAIPTSSVIFDKNKYWVVVFKDRHQMEVRQINIYRQLDDITYINNGVNDGETVITTSRILIYDALNKQEEK